MPVLTRSLMNKRAKMVSGMKRKFSEMDESDDDTTTLTTSSDSDSEYEFTEVDELKDKIDDLKDEIKDHEHSYNMIVDFLVHERNKNNELEAEITKLRDENKALKSVVAELRYDTVLELLGCSAMLIATTLSTGYLYYTNLTQ